MYYGSGTGGCCCKCTGQIPRVHSSGGSTSLCVMTSRLPSWKYDIKSKIQLCESMYVYLKNNPAKFHPNPIWNDGPLGFFVKWHQWNCVCACVYIPVVPFPCPARQPSVRKLLSHRRHTDDRARRSRHSVIGRWTICVTRGHSVGV